MSDENVTPERPYAPDDLQPESYAETGVQDPEPNGYLSNKNYTLFKGLSLYLLPALAAAYFGLAQIWGLPKAEEVVGSVVVLETLIGAVLRISKARFDASPAKYDGTVTVTPDLENNMTDLGISLDPEAVATKKELLVKIQEG